MMNPFPLLMAGKPNSYACRKTFYVEGYFQKVLFSLFLLLGSVTATFAQQVVQIGTSTLNTANSPVRALNDYGWNNIVYVDANITSGSIGKIAFHQQTALTYTFDSVMVWMENTTATTVGNSRPTSNGTLVYAGPYTVNGQDWAEIEFQTPFVCNGTNIRVYIENHQGTASSTSVTFRRSTSTNTVAYNNADGSFPTGTGTLTNQRPNILLYYIENNDAGILSLQGPAAPIGTGTSNVDVQLKNFGANVLDSVTINWSINGVSQTAYKWSGTLNPLQSVTVNIGTISISAGTAYKLDVWTSAPNGQTDPITGNDGISALLGTPLSGSYSIGGSSPDFATLTDAVDYLVSAGVSGSVTFNLRAGTYSEDVSITGFQGAGASNTVVFQSESNKKTDVTISSAASYVIQIDGASFITIKDLTLANLSSAGNVVHVASGDNIIIENNNVYGIIMSSGTGNANNAVINSTGDNQNLTIKNNYIKNGSFSISTSGVSRSQSGLVVEGNVMEDAYEGLLIDNATGPLVTKNRFTSFLMREQSTGFRVENCDFGVITSNYIAVNSARALRLTGLSGSASSYALVANNMVYQVPSYSTTYAFDFSSNNYVYIVYNTLNVEKSTQSQFHVGFYATQPTSGTNSNVHVLNNNIRNAAGGPVVNIPTTVAINMIAQMDYNNYYTPTTTGYAFKWGTPYYSSLSDFVAASNMDSNSFFLDPMFYASDDLRSAQPLIAGEAMPLSFVTEDFYGLARDANNPSIGAHEFKFYANDAGAFSLINPVGYYCPGTNNVDVQIRNYSLDTLFSVDIHWSVNGSAQTTYNWSDTLLTGVSPVINIGSYNFTSGNYDVKIWTSNPNGVSDQYTANDTILLTLGTKLTGNFTIGGNSPDYADFFTALNDLYTRGICGPVTFDVRDGNYFEQLEINAVPGASATNRITFRSESGDSSKVRIIVPSSTSTTVGNFVFNINGASYFTFHQLTFERTQGAGEMTTTIWLEEGQHNEFTNSQFLAIDVTSVNVYRTNILSRSTSGAIQYTTFKNNYIYGGVAGFTMVSNAANIGNTIEGNIIRGGYREGIELRYQKDITVHNNDVVLNTPVTSGQPVAVHCEDCSGDIKITNNKLYLYNYGYGVYIENFTDANGSGLIANNFITVAGSGNIGHGISLTNAIFQKVYYNNINILTSSAADGRGFYVQNGVITHNTSTIVRNNNIVNTGGGYGLYAGTPFTSDNNNIYVTGSGYIGHWAGDHSTLSSFQTTTGQDANSISIDPLYFGDYDLHVTNTMLSGKGTPVSEVTHDIDGDLRNATAPGIGADEITVIPLDAGVAFLDAPYIGMCHSHNDMVIRLQNFGTDTIFSMSINYTINGVLQAAYSFTDTLLPFSVSDPVILGSYNFNAATTYEFKFWTLDPNGMTDNNPFNDTVSISNFRTGLSGAYTIGGTNPDYSTINAAVNALVERGVCGNVTFNIRSGTYNERVEIPMLPNIAANRSVTFQSQTGDSTDVVITQALGGDNYTVALNNASYIILKHLTIERTGTASGTTNATAVELRGSSTNNTITNCVLQTIVVSGTNSNAPAAVVRSLKPGTSIEEYNTFSYNRVLNGDHGFYFEVFNTTLTESGNKFIGNVLVDQYSSGIFLQQQIGAEVIGNTITSSNTSTSTVNYYAAISCDQCNEGLRIEKNHIIVDSRSVGIRLNGNAATSTDPGIIANNFVIIDAATTVGTPIGVSVSSSQHQRIVFNSVNMVGNNNSSRAFSISGGSNNHLLNNILVNNGAGYAVYATGTSPLSLSDYNNFFTSGQNLGYSGGNDRSNLAAWQSATGLDAASININPNFFSSTNLRTNNNKLNGRATYLTYVTDDIDGKQRCEILPTVGAYEFNVSNTSPTASFSAPDTVCLGSPMLFFNDAATTNPEQFKWFINNSQVSSSHNFAHTFTSGGSYEIMLVAFNCNNSDTLRKTVVAANPTTSPVADFFADKAVVVAYENVTLTDLSSGCPTGWLWEIYPEYVDTFGMMDDAYLFTNSTSNQSYSPVVFFQYPGEYDVCITTTNSFGTSTRVCKPKFIKVVHTENMCSANKTTKEAEGYLYDDGGKDFYYSSGLNGLNLCTYTIDPCVDTLFFTLDAFDLKAGDYLRVYDGTDNTGTPLWNTSASAQGMTGTINHSSVVANMVAPSGTVYIEFQTDNSASTVGPGFAANWKSSSFFNGTQIIAPMQTGGTAGNWFNPDVVCPGDTVLYEFLPPSFSSNLLYGSEWKVASVTIESNGTLPADTSFNTATSFNNAGYRIVPKAAQSNDTFKVVALYENISSGCTNSIERFFVVKNGPSINSISAANNCQDELINFSANVAGSNLQYLWKFGNGDSSAAASPSYSYSGYGNYNISVRVSSAEGCSAELSSAVVVHPLPVASFTLNNICENDTAEFTDASTLVSGNIVSHSWDLGNGNSQVQNPRQLYSQAGTYPINLIVTSDSGCTDVAYDTLTVHALPVAAFNVSDVCADEEANFVNISSSTSALGYEWDFGDNSGSTAENPSHTYAANGNYNVSLIATSAEGCTDTVINGITVFEAPVAAFTVNDICVGDEAEFVNASTVSTGVLDYEWNFDNGNTSILNNPKETFSASGNYNVQLIATSANGCTDTFTASIHVHAIPVANFSVADGCQADSLSFVNTSSTSGQTNWHWNFGDGDTSVSENPLHKYAVAGTYNVELISVTAAGCSDTASHTVEVFEMPVASFSVDDVCLGETTIFLNNSTTSAGSLTFDWDFDNGYASKLQNPMHTFTSVGTYNVSLIATGNNGCRDTIVNAVQVLELPESNWTVVHGPQGQMQFTADDQTAANYKWYFGDGDSATIASPAHTYGANGIFTVTLVVTSANGCKSTTIDTVQVINTSIDPGAVANIGFNVAPNPFKGFTNIKYSLEKPAYVTLEVYDLNGRKLSTLVNTGQQAGEYNVPFSSNESNLSQGIYLVRLVVDGAVAVKRIVEVK